MTQRTSPNPWLGLICGVLAAVGYSLANICLRWLTDLDPIWVSFFKAIPTVVLLAPIAIWQVRSGRYPMPKASAIAILIFAAIISQLFGNAMLQWSFGIVGVAMSVPLCLGTMIVVGVMISHWLLQESLTRWQRWGTASLVLALACLSLAGRGAVQSVVEDSSGWLLIGAGIVAPMLAGISYAFLSVAIRRGVSGEVSMFMTTSLICAVGMGVLGPLSLVTSGLEEVARTTAAQYGVLLIAGLLNAAAFVSLTLSFRYAPVIIGNAANSLQNPLSALAGVVLFHEAYSMNLIFGVVLTVLGVVMMGLRDRPAEEAPEIKTAALEDGR